MSFSQFLIAILLLGVSGLAVSFICLWVEYRLWLMKHNRENRKKLKKIYSYHKEILDPGKRG